MYQTVLRRVTLFTHAPLLGLACIWVSSSQAAEVGASMQAAPPPFEHYQNWRDEPLQDWRSSNERVGEIGGWLTYLRDAQQDHDNADTSTQGHHGHHGH